MKTYTLLVVGLLTSLAAFAQSEVPSQSASTSGSMMMKGACAQDAKQFCSDITQGGGRVAACLKAHDDKISSGCRDQMHQMATEMRQAHQACNSDIQKFCGNIQPGGGAIGQCLKQHETDLSTQCKNVSQKFEQAHATG